MRKNKLTSVKVIITLWAMVVITCIVIFNRIEFLQLATFLSSIPLAFIPANVIQKKILSRNMEDN